MQSKRIYSSERKQELINEYLNSKLSKSAFKKKYNLPNSFYSWFRTVNNDNNFVQVALPKIDSKPINLNLIINSNQKIELILGVSEAVSLIRGLICN